MSNRSSLRSRRSLQTLVEAQMGSEGKVNSKEDEKSGGILQDKGSDEDFGGYGRADFWNDESGVKTSRKRKRGLDGDEGDENYEGEEEEGEFTTFARQGRRALMIKERCFDDAPAVRGKSKTTSSRRRRKFVVSSDSDSVSPKSSDFDYTSLLEETANELSGNLKTSSRSSVFLKKIQQQRKYSGLARQICIICLSKEGKKGFRGTLDCCDHFFCFTCISKWAKVESSCPVCKRRFETISKNPFKTSKTATDWRKQLSKRFSKPERAIAGVDLRSEEDTNENVISSACTQGGDDDLM